MQASSTAPAPDPSHGPQLTPKINVPGPSVVPPRQPERRKTALWGVLVVIAVLGAGSAYYLNTRAQNKVSGGGTPVVTVPTVAVSLGTLSKTVRISGTVQARNFALLLAPRIMGSRADFNRGGSGRQPGQGGGGGGGMMGGGGGPGGDFGLVLLSLQKPGTRVKAGDTVASFDPQFQIQRFDDYKDSVVQLENTIRKSMANLAATKEAHDQQIRTAKADWDSAILDLKTADVRSRIDAEKYKLAVEEAELKYKQLVAEAGMVDESQRAQIRASELDRDQSRIELQRAENNVKRMTIKAPMDGIVVMQSIVRNGEFGQIREGDQVAAGQPFMQIVDPASMVLNGTVNQVDAERLRLGMKAMIRLDAYPDVELPGTLIGIGAMSKVSTFRAGYIGEIPVRVKIEKADARLIPDLTGSAEIVTGVEADTLVAPRTAVFEEDGHSFVFVQGPDGWTRKQVDLGLSSFTAVSIRSGLQKGEVIALQRPL